jgi:hypothetical protein
VFFNDFKVAALVDSGSSINIMSKTLFDSIPEQYKLSFERLECSEIRLANNETIKVSGVANIELNIKSQGTVLSVSPYEFSAYIRCMSLLETQLTFRTRHKFSRPIPVAFSLVMTSTFTFKTVRAKFVRGNRQNPGDRRGRPG